MLSFRGALSEAVVHERGEIVVVYDIGQSRPCLHHMQRPVVSCGAIIQYQHRSGAPQVFQPLDCALHVVPDLLDLFIPLEGNSNTTRPDRLSDHEVLIPASGSSGNDRVRTIVLLLLSSRQHSLV